MPVSAPAKTRIHPLLALGLLVHCPLASAAQYSADQLMDMSLTELMNIEVTSVSRRPEKLAESAAAIQVITHDQIRRSGATSIPEALRLATNLNVAQQSSHEWIVSSRGFSSDVGNKLLVMIDGRTVYTPLFSGVFWDRQNYLLEDIERIEVISGPGGTLWGANAVNGVINIITRSATQTQGGYVEAGAGDPLRSLAGGRYGGKLNDNTAYRVYGQYFDRGPETLSDDSTGQDAWDMSQGGFRMDSTPNAQDTLTLQGDYYRIQEDLITGGVSDVEGANILSRWSRRFSQTSNMSLQFYYDRTELTLPVAAMVVNNLTLAPPGTFRDTLDTADLDFQHQFAVGDRQTWVWGLGYRYTHDDNENAPGLAFYPEGLQQRLLSAFAQDSIALVRDTLTLTLGTKVEKNDYTGEEWEPSVRLEWQLADHHLLWSAVSQAMRTPSRIDREISQASREYFVLLAGGEDFISEELTSYELGYRGQFAEKATLSVALFYNDYRDLRSTDFSPATIFPLFFTNNLEAQTRGAEISVTFQATGWWQLRGGYNYLHEDISVKEGKFDFNNALNETADPENQFSLRSAMDLGANVELDIAYRWVDDLPTNDAGVLTIVPSYSELDLRLGWRPRQDVELALVGQNLLHDHHQEFGVPRPQQEEVGRNIYGKVSWHF
ncbi:MAG TPA: TonB-dependent receptor [Dongiaceae bacterium]|nr:TonB-dependent receptor [Dongiaceae bacterium]